VVATRRRFSKEFKQEAVQMANVAGVTITQIANELGIAPRLLGVWRKQLATSGTKAFPGRGKPHDEEMAALKRELARVKKERDFLKEAAAFFAKESK
jgi:transposase